MTFAIVPFTFFLGLAVGSFINVVIDRVPRGEGVNGRSQCDHCGRTLAWYELIPLLSFVLQQRRSRCCGKVLSWQYPLIELIVGGVFVMVAMVLPLRELPFFLPLAAGMIALFLIDLRHLLLPHRIVFPLMALMVVRFAFLPSSPVPFFLAGIGAAAFFLLIILLTRGRGMGGGDVTLAGLIGLSLGWPGTLVALYVAFIVGGLCAAVLLLLKRKRVGQVVPFGPFLIVGWGVALVWGDLLWTLYV